MSFSKMAEILASELGLRWPPVAVKLLRPGETPPPGTREPRTPLRHCQSLVLARRGKALCIPLAKHACTVGTHNLGLNTDPQEQLPASLCTAWEDTQEAATWHDAVTGPCLPPGSSIATVVMPLAEVSFEPDVIVVWGNPAQIMWLGIAYAAARGKALPCTTCLRYTGCVECVVMPLHTRQPTLSLHDFAMRSSTDIADDELMLSLPAADLAPVTSTLVRLAQIAIPEERAKIHAPPCV